MKKLILISSVSLALVGCQSGHPPAPAAEAPHQNFPAPKAAPSSTPSPAAPETGPTHTPAPVHPPTRSPEEANRTDSLQYRVIDGIPTRVITVDLASPEVKMDLVTAHGFPGTAESFESMVKRSGAEIAITGGFFDINSLLPIGDMVRNGKLVFTSHEPIGSALTMTPDKRVEILRERDYNYDELRKWKGDQLVLTAGPTLVRNEKVEVEAKHEGFHSYVMQPFKRLGIGVTANHRVILVETLQAVTFPQFAEIFHKLGAAEAINLDAGASFALYYRGRTLEQPERHLTNIVIFKIAKK